MEEMCTSIGLLVNVHLLFGYRSVCISVAAIAENRADVQQRKEEKINVEATFISVLIYLC